MGIKPVFATKTVATAGTRVQLSTTDLFVSSLYLEALKTNTGDIFVGDSTVSSTAYMACIAAREGFNIAADLVDGANSKVLINLKNLYVDSSVNGEKVQLTYQKPMGED